MVSSSMNVRASAPKMNARARALTHRLTRAIMDRHCADKCDETAEWCGADTSARPPSLPDYKRLLSAAFNGSPLAATMSKGAIKKALASGFDPYAILADGDAARQAKHPPLSDLLCAIFLARSFSDCDQKLKPFPAGVTFIKIPDASLRDRIDDAMDFVAPFLHAAVMTNPPEFSKSVEIVTLSAPVAGVSVGMMRKFGDKLDDALAKGLGVIALGADTGDLSDGAKALLVKELTWPNFSSDDVIDLLRATHSATGEVAEAELRKRLPEDEHISRLPWPVVNHAFHAESTLEVAGRLAAAQLPMPAAPRLTLDDVCGLPEITEALWHLVDDVVAWKAEQLDWADVSSSILLYGPPGVGKTMLAEALAGSANATFVATSYADCQKAGHLGDYLRRMSELVDRAIASTPSVFFIDEIDSYRSRQSDSRRFDSYMHSVVNGLLTQLSRLNDEPGVIVIAATNHPDMIDAALIRAGRFDQKIAVGLPDRAGIEEILCRHLDGPDFSLGAQALRLVGIAGADIAAVARLAKGHARKLRQPLSLDHLKAAVDETAQEPDAASMRRKALHEAGHAVVAYALGLKPGKRIYIAAVGGGYVSPVPRVMTPDRAENELAMRLGGRAAEIIFTGTASTGSGGDTASDLALATDLAIDIEQKYGFGNTLMYGEIDRQNMPDELRGKVEQRLQNAAQRAWEAINVNRPVVERVVDALLEHRELSQNALRKLLSGKET